MWGRQRDLYSTYKRVSSKEHLNGYAREDSLGRPASGVWKEIGNPSWKRPLPHVLVATLSSFLFGYHLGVVNDTLESMSLELSFSGSTLAEGLVVSACLGGAFVGSIFSGWTADGVGRRRAFQLCALPMIIGASTSAITTTLRGMLLGRLFVGIGMGLGPPVAALYVAEVSPAFVRGTYGSFTQIATCLGLIVSFFIGIPAKEVMGWWRVCFWVSALPAALLAILMEFCAESPHWLFKRGRIAETEEIIERLFGASHVKYEMAELTKSEKADEVDAVKFSDLFYGRHFRVVFIGSTLYALQQLSGINAVFYFSSTVFKSAGVPANIANTCVGLVNLLGSIVAMILMDKLGRKVLLIWSFSGIVYGFSSYWSKFTSIRLYSALPISWWHASVRVDIFFGCWSSPQSAAVRDTPWPNQGKGHGFLYGCALGDKFFCRPIVSAVTGTTWATNSLHSLRHLLPCGSGLCEEEYCRNKRKNTPRN